MRNKYEQSWSLIYFDCPNDTKAAKAARRKIENAIKKMCDGRMNLAPCGHGWTMVCRSPSRVEAELSPLIPPDGELRITGFTDKQFEIGKNFWGRRRTMADAV